ncbi:MAG: hypothetical protein IH989_00220 [Planctomycetes bacterium]|nr:hypothetical protein [Planctomycetota bacterium]
MAEEKNRRQRGRNTPFFPLGECVQFVQVLHERIGKGPFSRSAVAAAWDQAFKSGAFDRKIGALMHFGLLERSGTQYRVSQEAMCIVSPTSTQEESNSIVACARGPVVYAELFAKFQGQALPARLSNVLSREHGVALKSSEDVAKVFLETVAFAKLERHGILHTEPHEDGARANDVSGLPATEQLPGGNQDANRIPGAHAAANAAAASHVRGNVQDYTIPLKGTGECAMISLPVPLQERDLKQVKAWLDYMLGIAKEEEPDISKD